MAQKFTQNDLSDLTDASNSYVDAEGNIQTFQKVEVPFNYKRGNPGPLDKSSTWTSLSAAKKYAAEDPTSYVGQLITVNDGTGVSAYVIDNEDGDLKSLATGGSADEILQKLNDEIDRAKGAENYISSEVSTLIETTLPLSIGNLESNLSIELTKSAGTTDGILSTYTITQGGELVGSIDIPKDKVIEEASVVTFKTDEEAAEATGNPDAKAGTYIKFKIQNQEKAIYVPVPELVNTYKGYDSDTVKLDVVHGSGEEYTISAIVKDESIGFEHMTSDVTAYVDNLNTKIQENRDAITILSGDDTVDGSVKKALKDAKAYTDQEVGDLSTSLSMTVDEKISNITDNYALSADVTNISSSLFQKIDNDVQALSDSISATVDEKLEALEARAEEHTDTSVKNLSISLSTTVDAQRNNLVDVYLPENYQAKGNYLSTEVANDPTPSDKLVKNSEVEAKIANLDVALSTFTTDEILASIEEVDGKIRISKQKIQIDKSMVNDLTSDLSAIDKDIKFLAQTSADHEARISDAETAIDGLIQISADLDEKIDQEIEDRGAAVGDLSVELHNKIDQEIEDREDAIENLSTSLSTTVDEKIKHITDNYALSDDVTSISSSLFQKIEAGDAAVEAAAALSVANLSNTVDGWLKNKSKGYVNTDLTGENKIATLADIAGLSGVTHLRDPFTNDEEESKKTDKKYIVENFSDIKKGDIFINTFNKKEYLAKADGNDEDNLVELGDEGIYATKADLEVEQKAREAADELLSGKIGTVSADLDALEDKTSDYSNEWKASVDVSAANLCAYAEDLSDAIKAEVERAEGIEETLSNDLSTKVFIQDAASEGFEDGKYTNLSVIKVTEEEYMAKVADGTLLKDGVLYVISSDHINAYGQQIVNVAAPSADTDAANKLYVDTEVKKVADSALSAIELNGLSFDIENNTATLTIDVISCGTATLV